MKKTGPASVLQPGDAVVIRNIKSPRRPDLVYPGICLRDNGEHIVLSATRILPSRDIGPVIFEPGDLFVEHYWRSRWYGVLQVSSPGNELKGWYGNISEPAEIHGKELHSRDLELDLWIPASGVAPVRLDEDEFIASGLTDNHPELARHAIAALEELEDIVARGKLAHCLSTTGR